MSGHYKILVADDREDNRGLLREWLSAQDYHVRCARDGREALELARQDPPDLILLDEPYQGFDRGTYENFWDHVESWRERGAAVVVVTHMLTELHRVDEIVDLSPAPIAREEAVA